jgi:peptidoglycan/xylan/chitin deacetylase (PgdA/CDA1 family)
LKIIPDTKYGVTNMKIFKYIFSLMHYSWIGVFIINTAFAQYENGGNELLKRKTFQWPEGKKIAISLTFDDARTSQLDVGMPIINKHGIKATFYVSPNNMESRKKAWIQAVKDGHEIANHSLNHPCTGNFSWSRKKALENYTLEQMQAELKEANNIIEKLVGVQPKTFAYPCGQKFVGRGTNLKSYIPLIAEMFLAGRGWLDESTNDPAFCDPAQLLGTELDGLTFEQTLALIEEAKKSEHWLIFAGHDIGEPGRQTVLATTLDKLCQYASDPNNKIWMDTVEHIADYMIKFRKEHRITF